MSTAVTKKQEKEARCAGCGKQLDPEKPVFRIAKGKVNEEGFDEIKEWGYLHEDCFHRAVESPKAVLDEVRKLAKAKKVA